MQLLNDDPFGEEEPPREIITEHKKFRYHTPLDKEGTEQCFKMLKDQTLFSSPLSEQQVKSEI